MTPPSTRYLEIGRHTGSQAFGYELSHSGADNCCYFAGIYDRLGNLQTEAIVSIDTRERELIDRARKLLLLARHNLALKGVLCPGSLDKALDILTSLSWKEPGDPIPAVTTQDMHIATQPVKVTNYP